MSTNQANFSSWSEFPSLPPLQYETDWSYNMRREMQEIIPGLYLGPYAAATKSKAIQFINEGVKLDVLQRLGITHIVCVRHGSEANFIHPNFPEIFSYLVLNIADSTTEIIVHYLTQFNSFVDQCLHCNGKVLVHGNAGISRSAALVIGYIMDKFGQRYNLAVFRENLRYYDHLGVIGVDVRIGLTNFNLGHISVVIEDIFMKLCKYAFNYVQQQRFCINLNLSFEHQLYEYEKTLFARREVDRERYRLGMEPHHDVGTIGQLKRKLHEREEEDLQSSSDMT